MNRRQQELESEIAYYQKLLDESDTISECLVYQGKLDILEREKLEIESKNNGG